MLVDWEIQTCIEVGGSIKVSPFDKSLINPNSLDVRLGNVFQDLVLADGHEYIDPRNPGTFRFEKTKTDRYGLGAGKFVLACLMEDITLAPWICAEIRGKSSLGRLGLINSAHAGWVDGGWSGVLTIELSNVGPHNIVLTEGMKIGQMLFHSTEKPAKPYSVTGRYNRQDPGAGSLGI